jgi:hypothetical protein
MPGKRNASTASGYVRVVLRRMTVRCSGARCTAGRAGIAFFGTPSKYERTWASVAFSSTSPAMTNTALLGPYQRS